MKIQILDLDKNTVINGVIVMVMVVVILVLVVVVMFAVSGRRWWC